MKYLKTYKIFENIDEISQNINDIFIELKDKNPKVRIVTDRITGGPNKLKITFNDYSGPTIRIRMGDIKDELIRLRDYLEMEGYQFVTFNYVERGVIKYARSEFSGNGGWARKSSDMFKYLFDIYSVDNLHLYFR